MKIGRKKHENDKYPRLDARTIKELIDIHKIYCISLHPLWGQVCERYWEISEKYWTPRCQVVSFKKFREIAGSVVRYLKLVEWFRECKGDVEVEENILLDLMEYYANENIRDEKCLDQMCFSAMMAYVFSQFLPFVNVYSILYTALAVFFGITRGIGLSCEFYENLPIVKVWCM